MNGSPSSASTSSQSSSQAISHQQRAGQAWRALHQAACLPYRRASKFAWHFAQGKLGRDPVFRSLLERGDLLARSHVLDIGCGQGLLASLLAAADQLQARGQWPANWASAPVHCRYTGIELMYRDVARAQEAVGHLPSAPQFIQADMCHADFPACDAVVILDVLHYVDHAAQVDLLQRVKYALGTKGCLLLRVGDAADSRRYVISQWVDRWVTWVRGHRVPPTFGRPLTGWIDLLKQAGFDDVQPVPMSRGTPFANVLLVAHCGAQEPTTS